MKKEKVENATSRNNVKFEISPDTKTQGQTMNTLDKISNTTIEPNNGPNFTFRGSPPIEKKKIVRKRESFSLTQTTYKDARTAWHPLKDSNTPILNDLATIEKMKKSQRYPVPEKLLHKPDDF